MPNPFDKAGMAAFREELEKLKQRPQKRSPSRSEAIGGAVEALAAVTEQAMDRAEQAEYDHRRRLESEHAVGRLIMDPEDPADDGVDWSDEAVIERALEVAAQYPERLEVIEHLLESEGLDEDFREALGDREAQQEMQRHITAAQQQEQQMQHHNAAFTKAIKPVLEEASKTLSPQELQEFVAIVQMHGDGLATTPPENVATSMRVLLEGVREVTRNEKTNHFLSNMREEMGKTVGMMNPEREEIQERYRERRQPANVARVVKESGADAKLGIRKSDKLLAEMRSELNRPKLLESLQPKPGSYEAGLKKSESSSRSAPSESAPTHSAPAQSAPPQGD